MLTVRKVRVHVRNKNRYNVETRNCNFLYVEVNDFAGTTIGDIKEDVRRQSRGAIRVDELFLDNQSLADDRSVAHYNLEDGCILETTSNPFWVACLYIKASEVKQEMEGNPNDKHIQEWTQKSLTKKYTLIGLLLNSKNEYGRQPPHFYTLDEFLIYLERRDKKGANMHPDYTQKDMRAFEREYRQEFLGRYADPIAAFIDHHAIRLGHALPDEIEHQPLNGPKRGPRHFPNVPNMPVAVKPKAGGRRKQERYCDDCEEALAEVYCAECQGGLAICRRCSAVLHAGVSRRRHNLQDIEQAPSNSARPYIPRAFLAPFAIVLAMYNALTMQSVLSLTEDEIKKQAQPLTDTDLQDKQAGKYVGGFDCMENVLMNKGFVKKEAARVPTYALSASGQMLGQRLYSFYTQFYQFMESCRLPKVHNTVRSGVLNNRKICLIVDENERDKQRLLRYAAEKNIDAQVRLLPAGDYIWILTPRMMDPHNSYTGKDYQNEMVLPFVVERKSWEDFENSTNSGRFRRQINNMLGCGLANCFYLMEGGTSGLRNNPTQHHQQYLKGLLEKLVTENGFYVNYTSSWMKSAQWLLWFTGFLVDGWRLGLFQDSCISYHEYMSRVARQRGSTGTNLAFTNARRFAHIWKAQLFVDHIVRDSHGERSLKTTVEEELGETNRTNKHLLVIQDLEQYNKKRQSALNKCCEAVYTDPGQARDIVEEKLGPVIHNMLHYDIASYWQLYIQVLTGVYVVRTESDQDTEKMHRIFTSTFSATTPPLLSAAVPKGSVRRPRKSPKTATITSRDSSHAPDEPVDLNHNIMRRGYNPVDLLFRSSDSDRYTDDDRIFVHRPAGVASIYQHHNSTATPFHPLSEGIKEDTNSVAGHVIKKGRFMSRNESNIQTRLETADMNMVKPFSGQGYCVGTLLEEGNNSRYEQIDRSENTMQNEVIVDSIDKGRGRTGLVGGMWNSRDNILDEGGSGKARLDNGEDEHFSKAWLNQDQAVQNDDFVNSQNEEEIMKEILEKSAAEARGMSNEDEMMELAVEISKQKSSEKTNTSASNLSNDKELTLALKMSRFSKQCGTGNNLLLEREDLIDVGVKGKKDYVYESSIVNMTEEEQINHVIEMSKTETYRSKNKRGLHENSKEDELIKHAVEVSMKEQKSLHLGAERKNLSNFNVDGVIFIPDTEEAQMKLALEISKKDTPKKSENSSNRNRSEKFEDHGKSCKRKFTDSEYPLGKLAVHDLEKLSEEEQLKLAMEISVSQMTDDISISSQTKAKRSNVSEDRYFNCPVKLKEEFKTGVSPCKKFKHNQNYNIVNRRESEKDDLFGMPAKINKRGEKNYNEPAAVENEDLKKAMERSKVEHSAVKRVDLGKQTLDEEEIMKIVIERSKFEYSPYKMNVREKLSSKIESTDASSIEIIEINSQNSQETDNNDTHELDTFNTSGVEHIDSITESASACLQKDNCKSLWCSLDCNKKCNKKENEENEKVGDGEEYIPPSPGRPGSTENITFSPQFFSRTSENTSKKPKLNRKLNSSPQTSFIKRDITFHESSRKYENEISDGCSEKVKASACNDTKFDIKASLFYNSDDSDCESEANIFDHDDETESRVGKYDNEDVVRSVKGANNADNQKSVICDIANTFVRKTEHIVEVKKKKIDKAVLNESKVKQNIDDTMDKRNDNSGNTALMSDSLKDLDQLPKTNQKCEGKDVDNTSEQELQPLDDYIDYDDDDNDIDYQPDSQDFKVESSSEESNCSDIEESFQERSDLDLLPLIRRPRKNRYRQLKEEEEKLYELNRKEKDLEKQMSKTGIKTERIDDTVMKGSEMTADELYAMQLQERLDREAKEEERKKLLIDDAYIARQLHEKINKEPALNEKESVKDEHLTSADITESTLNKVDSYRSNNNDSAAMYSSPEMFITESSATRDLSKKQVERMSSPEHIVRELQRRELEKIEKWRKLLIEDEKLAQRLQEMADDREDEAAPAASSESLKKNALSQPVETSFKKMVAQHKASKEKALAQLQQYRTIQMIRFKEMQNRSQVGNDTGYCNQSHENDVIILNDPQDQIAVTRILATSNTNPRPAVTTTANRTCVSENLPYIHTVNPMNQPLYLGPSSERSQSQLQFGSHVSHLNQSQSLDGDHVVQSNQSHSVAMRHSNVTCGNCGEKGHNRTFIRCPKYHTAEESARREAKLEKQRHQKEEKRKQEVETIHMLSEHKKMLEDMTSQIQREMGTIQDRLQQRSAELEAQVNLRVRKIENKDKKKKK